jgi:RNA polymerase sigma factor (sigma-70 family)
MSILDEKLLIQECTKNNRLAQKALFDKYSRSLFSISCRILNDYNDAHDALQDGFIDIFRDIEGFRNESSLYSWMKTIVVRKSIRILKMKRRFELLENHEDIEDAVFNNSFTAEELDNAIKKLPAGNRAIFLMIEAECYRHKEVAQILNISEGTSKSQLNYAKKLLKKILKENYKYER